MTAEVMIMLTALSNGIAEFNHKNTLDIHSSSLGLNYVL
jgi:hypothetical protein